MRSAVALALAVALVGGVLAQEQQGVFRARVDGVRMGAIVTNDAGPVQGLALSNFEVYDAGVRQTIESVEAPGGLALALVIDRSSSVLFGTRVAGYVRAVDRSAPVDVMPGWPILLETARKLLPLLQESDEGALLTFGGRIAIHARATSDRGRLLSAIDELSRTVRNTEPFSPVADAVMAAAAFVANRPGRPVVALLSDGVDNASWMTAPNAARALQRAGITVDLISVPQTVGHSEGYPYGTYHPDVIAEATGGRAFDATAPDVVEQLATRFAELRSSYVITYTPKGVEDVEGFHEVQIRLVGVEGHVQARPGTSRVRVDSEQGSLRGLTRLTPCHKLQTPAPARTEDVSMPDRTGSTLRSLLNASAVAVVVLLALLPPTLTAETGRQDYQALIDEYRRGDAEAAVTKLAAIGPDNIERLRPAPSVEEAPWDWAASILLRTEAKHRYFFTQFGWSFLRDPRARTLDIWNRARDHYEGASLRELRALVSHADRTGDERLQAYCRAWYLMALHGSARRFFNESRDLFRGDPEALLARGRYLEFWMGPDPRHVRRPSSGWAMDWGRYYEFFLDSPEWNEEERQAWVAWETPWFQTEHGTFGTWARRALETYREALGFDPALTEARLRLGRVLYLMSRHGDALDEFERTLADARTREEVGTAYLAALFAGELHEFEGRTDEAIASYREAIAVCPSCPSASVALLSLYLASGGDTEGWQAMDTLLRHAGDDGNLATDPSATYVIFPGSFLQGQRYVGLRHWVRVE